MAAPDGVLVLTRREVAALLGVAECLPAVERALRLHAEGRAAPPAILGIPAEGGGFHLKAATLPGARPYFAVKANANFSDNPLRRDRPAIQGVVVLCDATDGTPLAVMDSIEITLVRTVATTVLAARHLARPGSRVATICGCGQQGLAHARALLAEFPLSRLYAFDRDPARARRLAEALAGSPGPEVEVVREPASAIAESDICVTCTPSRAAFVRRADVRPGTFVAAVGADSPDKQELEPALLAASTLVVDHLAQCATIGELHHALAAGALTAAAVHAELGEVLAGRKAGRTTDDEIVVFDSTGTALQDVAAAALVYEKARRAGGGIRVRLGDG